jgi:hypothetical protein
MQFERVWLIALYQSAPWPCDVKYADTSAPEVIRSNALLVWPKPALAKDLRGLLIPRRRDRVESLSDYLTTPHWDPAN